MTIYLDVILIENLAMNYIILYATAMVAKVKAIPLRLFFSGLIGAVYAIISYIKVLEIYSSFILKILLSIIMVYIAFNAKDVKNMFKQLVLFYLTSFVFGGVAFSLIYLINPENILMKNGVFIGTYTLKIVALGALVGFIVINLGFKFVKNKIRKNQLFCNIKIKLQEKELETKAMIDTGNLLKDPISNMPVVVVEHTLLYDILPKEILNNLENILGGDLEKIPEEMRAKYISKLKVIPFSSLGKQNGMLLGIKAEEVNIENEEENVKRNDVIIGIYDKSLTKRGEYRALLGVEML